MASYKAVMSMALNGRHELLRCTRRKRPVCARDQTGNGFGQRLGAQRADAVRQAQGRLLALWALVRWAVCLRQRLQLVSFLCAHRCRCLFWSSVSLCVGGFACARAPATACCLGARFSVYLHVRFPELKGRPATLGLGCAPGVFLPLQDASENH
eukprot:4890672-Pleurochrysis_carterae.AAC.1